MKIIVQKSLFETKNKNKKNNYNFKTCIKEREKTTQKYFYKRVEAAR